MPDQVETRIRTVDRRFDALDGRLDVVDAGHIGWQDDVLASLQDRRAALTRITSLGILGVIAANLALIALMYVLVS